MERIGVAALLLGIQVSMASAAAAEIYRWVDAQGRLHFSQSLDKVPPQQRREAVLEAQRSAQAGADVVQRYSGGETPARPAPTALGSQRVIRVPFDRRGTLMKVVGRLNDRVDVPFYVDTGASGISIPAAYLPKLGVRVDSRTPRVELSTANGVVSEPVVKIDSVQLGTARVDGLYATVSSTMQTGLLGGSFFNHFVYGVDAAEGIITLQRNGALRGGWRADQWRQRFRSVRAPLEELEAYLESTQISRPGRRQQLLEHRARLRNELRALEAEAQRAGVPAAWRE